MRDWFLAHGAGRDSFRPSWYPGAVAHRVQAVASALELHPGYFTFSFMRNPYRRFLSVYRHASRVAEQTAPLIPGHPASYGTVHEFAELCAELLADTGSLWGPRASAFLRENAGRRYGPQGIGLRHLRFVADHARPQVDFLPDCNPGRLFGVERRSAEPLSFIGAVETIDADFARVQEILGLPRLPLPRRNASGAGASRPEALVLAPATRRLIEEVYAADFAFTGCGTGAGAAAAAAPPRRPGVRGRCAARRVSPATRIRRVAFTLASLEWALELRIARLPALRRALAPLSRLRRRLA